LLRQPDNRYGAMATGFAPGIVAIVPSPIIALVAIAEERAMEQHTGFGVDMDQLVADPYPIYARLQRFAPLFFAPVLDSWLVTRYADIVTALTDPRFIKRPLATSGQVLPELAPEYAHLPSLEPPMLLTDPPDHTRMRSLVNRAFTPRVVEGLRPNIEQIANTLLDPVVAHGGADLMAAFAFPLPATVIAELLGVPPADRDRFQGWSRRIATTLDRTLSVATRQDGHHAELELLDYFAQLVAVRRRERRDDLIGRLIESEEEGTRLSAGELLSTCLLLLIAGHETTMNLIGSGVVALLQHPDQRALLQAQAEAPPPAVDELLRFTSPVQWDRRVAAEPIELGGKTIAAGQAVTMVLAAANRDPAIFAEPDRLDLARRPNPHLAFGRGIHYCLGAGLARLEGQIAFGALLRRMPTLRLDPDAPLAWNGNLAIRGPRTLPVIA
jgi:pimeloyl-[acyl-carrier protein] synthase